MESKLEERKTYHKNGQLEIHCFYRNGALDGEYKEWYMNGQLWKHGFYRNGALEGEYTKRYDNGQLWDHCFYRNDKLNGEYKCWYMNDQLKTHGFYKNGYKVCNLNDDTVRSIIKFQHSYRIHSALNKYFASRTFVEWWYSPTVKGGMLSKKEILSTINEM